MGMSNPPDPRALLENSRVLFNREEVAAAVQKMADEINEYYGDQPRSGDDCAGQNRD